MAIIEGKHCLQAQEQQAEGPEPGVWGHFLEYLGGSVRVEGEEVLSENT